MNDSEQVTDGDLLEREAEALVEIFNEAAADYTPDLEWFGMSLDHETDDQQFVLEAESYIDSDGISALRDHGRTVRYIEAYEYDGDIGVQIHFPVHGEVPKRDRCPECGSGNVEWGEDSTTAGLWCEDCEDYVRFESKERS